MIAHFGLALLVVRIELLVAGDDFLVRRVRKRRWIRTMMVLVILLEMTSPTRSLRLARAASEMVVVSAIQKIYAALRRSCEMRVSMRAMSRRKVRRRAGFSS